MRIHFIAIGGSAMHNMAIAMKLKGFNVSGSDDEILEPSRSRLDAQGLLPAHHGWNPEVLDASIDAVILGMHARADNPELVRAQELGLKIYSYPEYLFEQSRNKTRVVIGGSHGKTTITAMVLHVLRHAKIDTDFLVGAQLEGFEAMARITEAAPFIVLEGDEYLSSPIDRRPKFHLYHPHIALLSGIAWDHINVFPTFDNYVEQFRIFIDSIEPNGTLIWSKDDTVLDEVALKARPDIVRAPYTVPPHVVEDGVTSVFYDSKKIPLLVFGDHNLMNLEGAKRICLHMGVEESVFYEAIQTFKGAARRLELVERRPQFSFFKDFAHSPSKLKATTAAVKKQFPYRKLIACMELHTFSSLSENFLAHYEGAMALADEAYVYFNPQVIAHKKLTPITKEQVAKAFGGKNVTVIIESSALVDMLHEKHWSGNVLLMMTSGNFDGIDFAALAKTLQD